jgi:hypothetical protein
VDFYTENGNLIGTAKDANGKEWLPVPEKAGVVVGEG